MKAVVALLVFIPLFLSCALQKKDSLSNRLQSSAEVAGKLKQRVSESSSTQIQIKDSLNSDATLTIWPRGIFTFSPVTGFVGEAIQVQITAKAQRVKYTDARRDQEKKRQVEVAEKSVMSASKTSVETHRFKWQPSYYFILLFILLMIGFLYWFLRRV